jgi:hypothetical protein
MPSSSFLQHNWRSSDTSYAFESRTANRSYPARVCCRTSAIAGAMASLYELSGSNGDASGGAKFCKSTKIPQLLVTDWLPVQNKIMILCLSEGGIAMNLEGKVLLNTANRKFTVNSRVLRLANRVTAQSVEGMIRNHCGNASTSHLEWMVQKKQEYERLVFFVHYYLATGSKWTPNVT